MMTKRFSGIYFAFICVFIAYACAARAEPTALQGTYTINDVASDDIIAAIDRGIANMSFLIRPAARSRLASSNPRYQRIRLNRNGKTASIQFDNLRSIEMPVDGRFVPWTFEDNAKAEVSAQWSEAQLVMHIRRENGDRVNTFVLDPDGNGLKLIVKLSSPKFPKPITYVLAYRHETG